MPEPCCGQQVYEALLDIDSNLAIVPQLALAWKPLDPTTWEFELRPAVTFHDGTPFTAGDVVFSIERARAETSAVQTSVGNIAAVSAVDDHTVQINDHSAGSAALDASQQCRDHVRGMGSGARRPHSTNVDTGKETFASRHANGTGPFILEEFEPHGRWVDGPQSELVGRGGIRAQHRPHRSHHEE